MKVKYMDFSLPISTEHSDIAYLAILILSDQSLIVIPLGVL